MPRRRKTKVDKDIDDIIKGILKEATPFLKEFNKTLEFAARIYDGERRKYEDEHKVKLMGVEEAAKILGIKPEATAEETKVAFRKLAKKYHPDLNKNDPTAQDKFMKVRAAYEVMESARKSKHEEED